ncbi:hypothetical protein M011DRAFT_153865 [Sporormia fimetaria CBS 119925]|uniref:Uncharacterized protein n=1 Tax=Sporormia fimetaria CBS 119925 TaxID=1340428 RepID=A0A6A6V625_9PLEO|nr:hypothetical protein M011DRAFT_153865 [Sporormia fimetaria CBS 119925]
MGSLPLKKRMKWLKLCLWYRPFPLPSLLAGNQSVTFSCLGYETQRFLVCLYCRCICLLHTEFSIWIHGSQGASLAGLSPDSKPRTNRAAQNRAQGDQQWNHYPGWVSAHKQRSSVESSTREQTNGFEKTTNFPRVMVTIWNIRYWASISNALSLANHLTAGIQCDFSRESTTSFEEMAKLVTIPS